MHFPLRRRRQLARDNQRKMSDCVKQEFSRGHRYRIGRNGLLNKLHIRLSPIIKQYQYCFNSPITNQIFHQRNKPNLMK